MLGNQVLPNPSSLTVSSNSINGTSLQIVAKMKLTVASTNKIYIDDILVTGNPLVVSNDALTQVLEPSSQVVAQNISSLINNQSSAQPLMKFKLSEPSGADNLDTKISSIKFKNIVSSNQADLSGQFEDFSIYDGTNFIPISSIIINPDEVTLNFAEGDFNLVDDSSQEYELRGYLKSSGIIDGKSVVLELEASGITTYNSGSGFDAGNSVAVNSPEHRISVVATHLNFTSIPSSSLIKNANFSAFVDAKDINGNRDLDANKNVNLTIQTGTGILSGLLSKDLLDGEVVFDDLAYNIAENINIQASGSGLESAISNSISIISSQSTELSLSAWTPSSLNISSISNSVEDAVEAYQFSINDIGDDLESTLLNTIRFIPGDDNNVNWEEKIEEFILKVGDQSLEADYVLSSSGVDIIFPSSELLREISDGDNRAFSIHVYLKTKLVDGEILQIKIDNSHLGWSTSGSGLVPSFTGDFNGHKFKIDVIGTHLNFTSIPMADVEFASNFEVSVNLTDLNNNLDLNANQTVNLSLVDGKGNLSGTLTKKLNSGITSFDDLFYNYSEDIKLIVSGAGLNSKESDLIHILPSKSSYATVVDWTTEDLHISSLSVSEDNFKEVFRFQVVDQGDDQVESILKSIRLISGRENTMDWENDIGAFQLRINDEIVDVDFISSESSLTLNFADNEDLANLSDGQTIDLSLYIFLNEKSTDGEVFQAAIENLHSQWEVIGTQLLNEFIGNLEGKSFVVDIVGTELSFIKKPPKNLIPNSDFEVELKLIDKFRNQDLNTTEEARVSLASGTGDLTSDKGLSVSLIDGKFSWTDLKYDKAENFTLLIEVDGLEPILSDNISSLDVNSSLVPAKTPVLSQVLNPLAIDVDNSEVVFNFTIKDEASLDNLPTRVNSVKFYNKLIDSGLDWGKHLAGAVIKKNGEIVAKTTKVEYDYISFTSLDIEIENGKQVDFELAVYFKKSLIPDHAKFQVEIRKKHQWKTSTTGSLLVNVLSESIVSAIHEINVNADRLSFISNPIGIEKLAKFKTTIAAVDEFQNIDVDKYSSISLNSQGGILSKTGVVGNLVGGKLEVRDLNFSGKPILELTASSDLQSVTQEIFVQEEIKIFIDDFESEDLALWDRTQDWTASSYLPIAGSSSLKHNLSNTIGSSCVTCPLNGIDLGSESIFWEFILKNSDWDPSSSNNFTFHLLMDSNDPNLAKTLYSVGVNLSGSNDRLNLWKTFSGDSELLIESDFDWNENENVAMKVEYNSRGEWKLYYNRLGNKNNWLKVGEDISEVEPEVENWYSGLEFNFETASRAGELWFDDLKIQRYNTAPYLRTFEFSSDSISLNFSEDLNFLESSRLDNFSLKRANDQIPVEVIKNGIKGNQLILFLENQLLTGKYSLFVKGMIDIEGAVSKIEEIEFDFYAEAKGHDLIINEILADESPVVGLPEYEFIEIYNASDHPINIKDFKLTVGKSEKTLGEFVLPSNEYLILCSNAAVDFYKEFGNSLGVSSFPSLTNSGTNISLESPAGILMDEISYSSGWYGDDLKKDGGWSLERIDIENYCSTTSNWRASNNENGGSPGEENSIKGVYQDTQAPELISYFLQTNQTLQITFSEDLDESSVLMLSNYTIEGNNVSSVIQKSNTSYILHFADEFQDEISQSLVVNNLSDECGNSSEINIDFIWNDVHKYDLIINEILADESPVVGLPEYEFIEVYNASDHPINIKDFKLTVGKSEKTLGEFVLPSNEYLILCSNAAVDFYKEFGNSLGVSSFPSLTNSGTNISLESSAGILMDEISYSSDWYDDEDKKDGGWSLERIDVANYSWQPANWKASNDELGGTPGKVNSVEALNPDITKPKLLRFELNNSNSINLFFSESLDLNPALNIQNYLFGGDIGHPASVVEIENEIFVLRLNFSSNFENNIQYQLVLSDQLVDLAGNLLEEYKVEFILAEMPHTGDLVINEVLFNPYPDGADYVELLNISDRKIDIKDLLIANRDENYQLDAIYKLSEKSQILEAGAYLLLSKDTANVKLNYCYLDEDAFIQLVKMPSFNDDEGRVVILNRNNDQLDDFAYDEAMHFSQLTSKEGVSLERINPNKETNSNSNWISASQTVDFGTPGMQNSSYDIDEVEVNEIGFKSKMFSPDNDGVDDRLIINFELEKSGYVANIRVYNSLGVEVRRLASNLTLSTKDELFWDGLLANKERASIGIYVFYFELFHPDGEVKTYKKTCVLGGKFK